MKDEAFIAYIAPDGFVNELVTELGDICGVYDRLVLAPAPARNVAWAQNVWLNPQKIPIQSISNAVKALRAIQRDWANYSFQNFRRSQLIQEQLPKVSHPPLEFLASPPSRPLGSWALLEKDLLLASPNCTSQFPNGEMRFIEDKSAPSRAYLKLWELFTVHGVRPQKGDRCLDLGSSPGGWTWVLQQLGCDVFSVDKAGLDPSIENLPGVHFLKQSAFGLDPKAVGPVDWLFSDIICYPSRLLELVEKWLASGLCRNFVCTVKFQGSTDHETTRKFAAIPNSRLMHLYHNKHELTWMKLER